MSARESVGEFLRPAPRPEWGRDDVEWWWKRSDGLRLPAGDDEQGRTCSIGHCSNPAVIVRLGQRYVWKSHSYYSYRHFRCREHVYTDYMIEDGEVYVASPRWDLEAVTAE